MAGHRSKAWIFGVAVALAVGGALFGGAKGLPAKAGPSCIGFSHGKYVSNVVFAGQVHVFEYNSCDSALEHDWFSGSWHSEILDGSGATPYSGNQTTNSVGKWNRSIVYGGQLHNFYYDDVAGSLRHAWWNGSSWNFEYLDGASSSYPGASIDHRVGYSEDTTSHSAFVFGSQLQLFYPDECICSDNFYEKLRHAWFDGTWHFETLDGHGTGAGNGRTNSDVGTDASAVAAPNGQVHVFYSNEGSNLRHGWYDGTWHFEYLDGASATNGGTFDAVGGDNSAIVYNGQVHDFYIDHDAGSVRHAWWNGTAWHFEAVDGGGGVATGATGDSVGFYNSTVVYNGQLQLFTEDTTSDTLRHAWFSGAWHAELLDGQGSGYPGHSVDDVGQFSSALVYAGQLQDYYTDFPSGPFTLREAFFNGSAWNFVNI